MAKHWVLVRGMMSEAFHWRDLIPLLQARFPEDQIHTANILGTGPTGQSFTPTDLNANIEALRAQVPDCEAGAAVSARGAGDADGAAGGRAKKILVGFSLGGMLALEWAYSFPEEVEAVVAINVSLGSSPFYERMTPFAFGRIARSFVQPSVLERERLILDLTTELCGEKLGELAREWAERGEEFPVHPLNFFRQLRLAARIAHRPEAPSVPTYLFLSAKDRVVNPKCSRRIAQAWRVPLLEHPRAGHDLTLDDPEWVVRQLGKQVRGDVEVARGSGPKLQERFRERGGLSELR